MNKAKERYFKKIYENAELIKCACGCGEKLKNKDKYGRDKKFINGHNGRKYKDKKQHKREWNYRNRRKRYKYKVERSKKMKVKIILSKNGYCKKCNLKYDGTNAFIFDFHHINPSDKLFNLNLTALQNKSKKDIQIEAEKCELICSNCHRLLHCKEY